MDEPRQEKTNRREMKKKAAAADARRRSQQKRRRKAVRQPGTQVNYTPAKPLDRRMLLIKLVAVAAVVAALAMGVSIFFKVRSIQVTGNTLYSADQIAEASGIEMGENLLAFGKARAAGEIKSELPYVDTVQIGIKFPDVVIIDVTEIQVTYALRDVDGQWWLMDSEGRILEQATAAEAENTTQILGIAVQNPTVNEKLEVAPETQTEEGETVVSSQEKLDAVLEILSALEANGCLGQVTKVDVTQLYAMELWYGEQYQVLFGGPTELTYKVRYLTKVVEQLADYQTGVIDLTLEEEKTASFTPW